MSCFILTYHYAASEATYFSVFKRLGKILAHAAPFLCIFSRSVSRTVNGTVICL